MSGIQVAWHEAMSVGESPLWHHGESSLYWVDINQCLVHRLHPASGQHASWRMDSEPSSLAIDGGGGLLVATRQGIVHLDPASDARRLLYPALYDTATTRFNDGKVDPAGRYWIGTIYEPRTSPAAEMFCLDKGELRKVWSGGMTNSNGLAFAPDGRTMYHADTASHRIDCYDFDVASGRVGKARAFQLFSADKHDPAYGGRPDGATIDSEGCYWVAMFEGARVLRFAPDGKLLREILLPVRCPTMLAFGGDDLRTLYITSASHGRPATETASYPLNGRLLSIRVEVAGRPEPVYQA
ncbi:SMP-30/gluconolactonase/LRE family protein [Massilia sp. TS11]|uniref:SMP-30/gluconolactonase/LRE family protein n=1 Tax=Massilia sp. TS11 TaxID=2908003 RepID=UPI001EDBFFD4|nr:SMP-30/gluconolactonase/LRE family protein [Massilia sp. TS11]MCG2582917.1 SMP-30/gluconolactonase/LRE family protein [Massilia sp. TS11]